MATKQMGLFTLIVLLTLCLQVGCNKIGDSISCTAVACHDAIRVRLLPTDTYLPGTYSVALLFSDDESINAEFELAHVDENDDTSDLLLQVIENESYATNWSMFNELVRDANIVNYDIFLIS